MPAATLSPDAKHSAKDTAASIQVLVDGSPMNATWAAKLVEAQVRDFWTQPDMAYLRFHDPLGDQLDQCPLKLATAVVIKLGADGDRTPKKVFDGEVVALEPEFGEDGLTIGVRAFDKGHRFNRTKRSAVYLKMKASEIVKQAIGRAGVGVGTVEATNVVYDHFQQSTETDWELCWRLARMNGYEFGVDDGRAFFRKRKTATAVATLTYQRNLVRFSPRISAIGQVSKVTVKSQDPKQKAATTGLATSVISSGSAPPITNTRDRAIHDLGGGEALVADRVASDGHDANTMAQGALARNAAAFLEAEGLALGSPELVAGATVKIQGIGTNYSGEYVLSSTHHVLKGGGTYMTRFEITGDRPRTFAQLVGGGGASAGGAGGGGAAGDRSAWASQLVIAYVTNNNDPDNMGRVKVKFDSLGDNMESEWARVATLGAGNGRGVFMLPQMNDTVIVGFEHGDPRRPFVLGTLYSGKDPLPADLKDADARKAKFAIKTDHQILAQSSKELKLHTDEKMTIEVKGNPGELTVTSDGDAKLTSQKNVEINGGASVKIKGNGSVEIEASGQLKVKGATVSVEGSGMVEVKGGMIKLG